MIVFQILMFLYAIGSAYQEAGVVQAFRDYVPINNKYVKAFHNAGGFMTLVTACLCSFVATKVIGVAIVITISLCIYWLVFDIALNLMTGKKWHYIGTTAKIDKFLTNLYEDDAGKIKAAIVLVMIAGLNILNALV